MKSLVIMGLSKISKLFLKLSRKMWLYISTTTLNQTNLMNLYNQPIIDFIAATPPSLALTTTFCLELIIVPTVLYSCCLTGLLLLTLSTTISCLKDLTLDAQFVVLLSLLTGFSPTLQTAHNLP